MLPPDPDQWQISTPYLRGIELFNSGAYWEAHEAWEEIWLDADGIQSEFLQGLIQCAAALLKYTRNEADPARRLYGTATRRLALCPDSYMGLNVREFQAAMAECFAPVIGGPYREIDPANIPRIDVG
ncbi:MAG TPA: DUF309 domain-containing protein [Planctomycetota bacterium]|nr:DUF309 domain-containing protein [Planctomycetota bacterium]